MEREECKDYPNEYRWILDLNGFSGKRVVLYGAGECGEDYYIQLQKAGVTIAAWVASRPKDVLGQQISLPDSISGLDYDLILIGVTEEKNVREIRQVLHHIGVPEDAIVWRKPRKGTVRQWAVNDIQYNKIPVYEGTGDLCQPDGEENFETFLSSVNNARLTHDFLRAEEIAKRDWEARTMMEEAYEADKYYRNLTTDPGGNLTLEQQAEIEEFWKPYRFFYQNDPECQRIYSIRSGRFDPSYIPIGLFLTYLKRFWNSAKFPFIRDKNYQDIVFPQVRQAEKIVHRVSFWYSNGKREILSLEQAAELCYQKLQSSSTGKLIVKPFGGGGAKNILLLRKGYRKEDIAKAFTKIKTDFVCEQFIASHPSYAEANPDALNTLRVMTFTFNKTVHLLGIFFHFSVTGELANMEMGGLMARVQEDGTLDSVAYDENGNPHEKSPNGYCFAGKKLYAVSEAVKQARHLHQLIPAMRAVTWEFAVDEEGVPVLIELNGGAEQRPLQLTGGHTLISRDVAKVLLDDWFLNRSFYPRASWRWNYREFIDHVEIEKYCGTETVAIVPDKLRDKPVTALLDNVFSGRKLHGITIPATVKKLSEKTFFDLDPKCHITWERKSFDISSHSNS